MSERLIHSLVQANVPVAQRCQVGLYGGWYEHQTLTRSAQALVADVATSFPSAIRWNHRGSLGVCMAQASLAMSLHVDPARHLFFTFRKRPFTASISCDASIVSRCVNAPCPLAAVAGFLSAKRCTVAGCQVAQRDFLSKSEQKLIDTMLTSDLIYLAHRGEKNIVVVSSDDDIWPGIRTALALGANVTQIHTKRGRSTKTEYSSGLGPNYVEIKM